MATAALTSQLTDVSLDPGSLTMVGTGNAPASETVIQLQGTNAGAMGHSGSVGPTNPTSIAQFRGAYTTVPSFSPTGQHLHFWVRDLYPVRAANLGGVSAYLGGGGALYYMTGLDKGYLGDWFHVVLNLDAGTRPAASIGTAPAGNITRVGYCGNISGTKNESFLQNCYVDAIRRGAAGSGVTLTGGTSGDRLTFKNCADADTAAYGLFRDRGGSFFIEGPVTFGGAASTTWLQESLQTLNFANLTVNNGTGGNTIVSAVASDYYRVTLADATTGVTNIDLTDVTFKGVSRLVPFQFTAGLGTNDAYASTSTTYLFGSTVTLGAGCTSNTDRFVECVTVIPGGITLTTPSFSNCDAVTLTATGDQISGGTTGLHNTATGSAFITTDSLTKISNHSFDNTGGVGHAIELTTPGTYTLTGCDFTGYGIDGSNDAAIYNNSGGAVTVNIGGGGSTPTIRNGAASTTVVNNSVTVKQTCKDVNGVVIASAQVLLQADTGGSLPSYAAVTITRTGTTATVTHPAHGVPNGSNVIIRGADQNEYRGSHTVTVADANSYTYTVTGSPATPATGTVTATAEILYGVTDAAGVIQDTGFNYLADQPVSGWARKASHTPRLKHSVIAGNITSTGYDQTLTVVPDQ